MKTKRELKIEKIANDLCDELFKDCEAYEICDPVLRKQLLRDLKKMKQNGNLAHYIKIPISFIENQTWHNFTEHMIAVKLLSFVYQLNDNCLSNDIFLQINRSNFYQLIINCISIDYQLRINRTIDAFAKVLLNQRFMKKVEQSAEPMYSNSNNKSREEYSTEKSKSGISPFSFVDHLSTTAVAETSKSNIAVQNDTPKQTSKSEDELDNEAWEVLQFLNKQSGMPYTRSRELLSPIRIQLKKGHAISDLNKIIEHKCFEWKNSAEMRSNLRPSTLFGKNFLEYLAAAKSYHYDKNKSFYVEWANPNASQEEILELSKKFHDAVANAKHPHPVDDDEDDMQNNPFDLLGGVGNAEFTSKNGSGGD